MVDYQEVENTNGIARGTYVKFKPDAEVFNLEPINISFERVCDICKNLSYLTKGLKFTVELAAVNDNPGEIKVFMCEDGLVDLIKDTVKSPVHNTVINYTLSDDTNTIEIALQWAKGREKSYCFTNGVLNAEGGTPITGIKTSITRTLNKCFKGNLTGELARTGLVYAVSCKVANPSFANQTKTKINNPELRSLADKAFAEAFTKFKDLYPNECKKIEDFLLKEKKAEEAAQRAREKVLEATKDIERNQKKKVFASDKLKDAEFLGEDSILLLVEGNSAASSMAMARDSKKYGILGLRGKCINCLSNPEDKIFENEEIKLLLSAMNIIPGKYDSKKLRYGKIAICVDADSDGYHISLLIMAALRYLAPQFLEEKRLCWLRSPLYIVKNGKKESYYFTDEEFSNAKPKGEITRAKGLGALSPDQARASMFGDYQRMDVLEPDPIAISLLEDLMGEEVQPRKDFIFSNIDFSLLRE